MKTKNITKISNDKGAIITSLTGDLTITPMVRLIAETNKILINGDKFKNQVEVPVDEVSLWTEIDLDEE